MATSRRVALALQAAAVLSAARCGLGVVPEDAACPAGAGTCQASAQDHLLIQTRTASSAVKRHSELEGTRCHTAEEGSTCHSNVRWAMEHGVREHPDWYPNLNEHSSFEDFQGLLHSQGHHDCDEPCRHSAPPAGGGCCRNLNAFPDRKATCSDCTALVFTAPHGGRCDRYCESFGHVCVDAAEEVDNDCNVRHGARCDQEIGGTSDMLCKCKRPDAGDACDADIAGAGADGSHSASSGPSEGVASVGGSSGWVSTGQVRGNGWCAADVPAQTFTLQQQSCGSLDVRVLSYNLYWWNLFQRRGGNDGSAGRLIAREGPFDIMGFQECEDVGRVIRDAGLRGYQSVNGGSALAIAWNAGTWERLNDGRHNVAEDRPEQHYGNRAVHWVRLRHRSSGRVVLFANHHGPLPVNTGGVCGGTATAYNILKTIADNAEEGDAKMLVGDFNSEGHHSTQRNLASRMHRVAHNWVDGIFGSCPGSNAEVLGRGGSDHEAISAHFRV